MKVIDSFFENDFKEVGYLVKTDDNGKLIIPKKRIQKDWHTAVYEIMFTIAGSIKDVHSIYLRGSAAQGCAIDNVSDLDFIVLVEEPCDTEEVQELVNEIVARKYPFIKYVDINFDLVWGLGWQQLYDMKIFSYHLFGINLLNKVDDIYLKEVWIKDDYILNAMSVYGRNETRQGCASVMKLLLRQMFGLVAEQQGVYTKSLYYCFKYLVDARPDVEELAKKIVYLAINPSNDVEEVKSVIRQSTDWYSKIREKELSL